MSGRRSLPSYIYRWSILDLRHLVFGDRVPLCSPGWLRSHSLSLWSSGISFRLYLPSPCISESAESGAHCGRLAFLPSGYRTCSLPALCGNVSFASVLSGWNTVSGFLGCICEDLLRNGWLRVPISGPLGCHYIQLRAFLTLLALGDPFTTSI